MIKHKRSRDKEDPYVAKQKKKTYATIKQRRRQKNLPADQQAFVGAINKSKKGLLTKEDVLGLSDKDLATAYKYNTYKRSGKGKPALSSKGRAKSQLEANAKDFNRAENAKFLEKQMVERLYKENPSPTLEPVRANGTISEPGVQQMISNYNKKYRKPGGTDIESVVLGQDTATKDPDFWKKKFDAIPEKGKKAYMVSPDPNAVHKSLVYVDKEKKSVYHSDSVGQGNDEYNQRILAPLKQQGYKVHSHTGGVQRDQFSCAAFCLKNFEVLDQKGVADKWGKSGLTDDGQTPVPAEILTMAQSAGNRRNAAKIGRTIDAGLKAGKTQEQIRADIEQLKDKGPDGKAKLSAKNKAMENYQNLLPRIKEDPKLMDLFFRRKTASGAKVTLDDESESPDRWVDDFRSAMVSKMFKQEMKVYRKKQAEIDAAFDDLDDDDEI